MNNVGKALKTFFFALISQVPMFGLAAAWWQGLFTNPVLAAGVAVLYELVILTWKEIGKPVWNEVWEQDLKPQTIKGLATWMNVTIRNLCSGFRRQYLQQVIFDYRVFSMRGLLTPGQGALEVEKVFVELHIASSHHLQISTNPLAAKALSGSQPIWEFLRRLQKKEATALAILGPPGCGKTTLLKHLALTFAARRHRRYRLRSAIPLLLFLRDHANAITEEGLSLGEIAQQYFSDHKRYAELSPPPLWFARQLRTGRCLVLLDGLDEVVDVTQRHTIIDWVDRQIRTYPRCQFLLTARPQGYRDAQLQQAHVLEVLPFTPQQVELFIRNWYLATKLIAYGKDDRGVRQDADREAWDLLQRLQERPRLKDLTVNPLLLTMIANVHNYKGALPERRVELYAEICDVLLGHWHRGIGMKERLTAAQRRVVLQPLAETMMANRVREMTTSEILTIITPHLSQVGVTEQDFSAFLPDIQANCGVLVEQEKDVWGFAHLTFQEYLCATQWKETGEVAALDAVHWKTLVAESWWHETLRLYAAQHEATPLVNACLELDSPSALRLAANIAGEALKLEHSLREAVTTSLARVIIQLRSEPQPVSEAEFLKVFKLDENWRPLEYIQNDYEDRGDAVIDHATGLMWQKSGSEEYLTYEDALKYIITLDKERFAGYGDWRLPTIPELMSLIEPDKQTNDLYLNPIFDEKQWWCWSSDRMLSGQRVSKKRRFRAWLDRLRKKSQRGSPSSAWGVYFYLGLVGWDPLDGERYVRAVRS